MDPLKEAQAAEVGLKNGIITYSDLYASEGKDWEESLEQRKREQDKIKDLGLEEVINNDSKPKDKTNKEAEIYKNRDDQIGIEKLRYPLIEKKGILVPDTTKEYKKLLYARVGCVASN